MKKWTLGKKNKTKQNKTRERRGAESCTCDSCKYVCMQNAKLFQEICALQVYGTNNFPSPPLVFVWKPNQRD